jgi:hypothetical protein
MEEGTADAKPFTVGPGYRAMLGLASIGAYFDWLIENAAPLWQGLGLPWPRFLS